MTRRKGLVLDANILLRAVFGQRVRELWEAFEDAVSFYSPDVCFDDARKYIPDVSTRRTTMSWGFKVHGNRTYSLFANSNEKASIGSGR